MQPVLVSYNQKLKRGRSYSTGMIKFVILDNLSRSRFQIQLVSKAEERKELQYWLLLKCHAYLIYNETKIIEESEIKIITEN